YIVSSPSFNVIAGSSLCAFNCGKPVVCVIARSQVNFPMFGQAHSDAAIFLLCDCSSFLRLTPGPSPKREWEMYASPARHCEEPQKIIIGYGKSEGDEAICQLCDVFPIATKLFQSLSKGPMMRLIILRQTGTAQLSFINPCNSSVRLAMTIKN